MPANRISAIIFPFFLFVSTLTVYVLTLSRSVYFGDSGEFIAVAKTLGIAHPPGYPLYTMLAHLFTYLPFGNLAFRVNLFSAVTSSLTVVVVYFICLKLTKNWLASASASLFLAFSYLFWLYSLVADTRSLSNLFTALIILFCLELIENPKNTKAFWLFAFILGLSLSTHPSIIFIAPALIFPAVQIAKVRFPSIKTLVVALCLFIFGLLPYVYLPIRASSDPLLNWGDPDTLQKFLNVIFRKDYGSSPLGAGTSFFHLRPDILSFFLSSLMRNFTLLGVALSILGILTSLIFKKHAWFLLISFIFLGPILINTYLKVPITGDIETQAVSEEFFITSFMILSFWISLGISQLLTLSKLKYLKLLAIWRHTVAQVRSAAIHRLGWNNVAMIPVEADGKRRPPNWRNREVGLP